MHRVLRIAISALMLSLLTQPAASEWSQDLYSGLNLTDNQDEESTPRIIEDGYGGYLTAWIDMRNGNPAIYAQKVDAGGTILWQPEDGVLVYEMVYDHHANLELVSDGVGGALIAFEAKPDDTYWKVLVTHVDSDGSADWDDPVDVAPGYANYVDRSGPGIVTDGGGGAIVVFTVDPSGLISEVAAQRISETGALLWGSAGTRLSPMFVDSTFPAIVSDGAGGAYAAWTDDRAATGDRDLYMQRLTPTGTFAWDAAGVVLSIGTGDQWLVRGVSDCFGGVLWCWWDNRSGNWDIYAQRVNPDGLAWWQTYGLSVCDDPDTQENGVILADGRGGAFLAWMDDRTDSWDWYDVYAQHISTSGTRLWGDAGMVASARGGWHGYYGIDIVSDGQGGVILVWAGQENEYSEYLDLFGQRIDVNGYARWGSYGCNAMFMGSGHQDYARAVAGTYGGVVTVFNDGKHLTSGDITMMYTDHHGYPGDPRPFITSVTDFPQDQGGVLMVDWERSYLDEPVNFGIRDYTLWRRLPAAKRSADASQDLHAVAADSRLCEAEVTEMMREGWSYMTTVDAATHHIYGFDAPSYGDSTDVGIIWTEYMVIARQTDTIFWGSPPFGGFSVDNLAPGAPAALAALVDGSDVELSWSASGVHDEDLARYLVYRGDETGFEISPASFVATATDTVFTDHSPGADTWFYRVTAVDVHGNEGPVSNEAQAEITTGVDDVPAASFALRGNRPNPFNPTTTISFELPEAGPVTLEVYDAAGRLVITVLDEMRHTGANEVVWHGVDQSGRTVVSGVYLARLTFGDRKATHRMVLLK